MGDLLARLQGIVLQFSEQHLGKIALYEERAILVGALLGCAASLEAAAIYAAKAEETEAVIPTSRRIRLEGLTAEETAAVSADAERIFGRLFTALQEEQAI
jgi:hypothetical protein